VLKVEEELARLTHSTYPVAQLLQRPLPDGVDPTRLELYVDPQHFQVNLNFHRTYSHDTNSVFIFSWS
jgi:supervillin